MKYFINAVFLIIMAMIPLQLSAASFSAGANA